jgi:phospholipid transport system substrate-binding protein
MGIESARRLLVSTNSGASSPSVFPPNLKEHVMSPRLFFPCFALSIALLFSSTALAEETSALESFRRSHEAVIDLVHKKAKDATIQREVDSFLDYQWLAQAALGGPARYQKRCEARCDEFEQLLARLIRQNYLKRIHQSDKGKVEYVGEEVRKKATKVTTKVDFKKNGRKQQLTIAYVMHQTDEGEWVCRDIITDGVSLAKTYRFEFNKILRDGGINSLIARLETKLAELAKAG